MKVKLSDDDEARLVNGMTDFQNLLERIGFEGVVATAFSPEGGIDLVGTINADTNLIINLSNDGNKKTVEYTYEE